MPSYMSPYAVMGFEMIDPEERNRDYVSYAKFLEAKRFTPRICGLKEVPPLNSSMFSHQRDVTAWALRLGRAAAFLGTGMGKSLIELEWARIVSQHTRKPVLILAPLAVAHQLVQEAAKFNILQVGYQKFGPAAGPIVVANYERLNGFDPSEFAGVVLDESSILKSFDGKTRSALIEAFRETPYKLCGTATPAPNDHMELGNHAEFLGVMTATEMLSMFFVHDGGETQKWRLKGHARKEFWKWVCSWAVNIRKPSDVCSCECHRQETVCDKCDCDKFVLPPLVYHEHIVQVDHASEGMLFAMPAVTLSERLSARRSTVDDRVSKCAEIVNAEPDESWIVWCNMNKESEDVTRAIPQCVELTGSEPPDVKVEKMMAFAEGNIGKMASKSSILGWGINLQVCARQVFIGVNDSFESFYQSIRRSWRFGQKRPVHVHIIAASTEGNVMENLKRKEREAEEMAEEMMENMQDLTRMNLKGTSKMVTEYNARHAMLIPSWLQDQTLSTP